jgi:hypothetical protein
LVNYLPQTIGRAFLLQSKGAQAQQIKKNKQDEIRFQSKMAGQLIKE